MFQQLKKPNSQITLVFCERVFFPWDLLPIFGSSRLSICEYSSNISLIKIRYQPPFRRIRGFVFVFGGGGGCGGGGGNIFVWEVLNLVEKN